MPKNVKCKNCNNLVNHWCEKIVDSPDEELERDCKYFWLKTNADRIRAMTDEELSMIMVQLADLDDRIHYCQNLPECEALLDTEDGISAKMCARCMLAWLKQPAEVDNG